MSLAEGRHENSCHDCALEVCYAEGLLKRGSRNQTDIFLQRNYVRHLFLRRSKFTRTNSPFALYSVTFHKQKLPLNQILPYPPVTNQQIPRSELLPSRELSVQ